MKILFFTDPHNSDTPPRSRKEGYREEILAKQNALIVPAKGCDLVICGGDVFHQKDTGKISHRLVNNIADIYRTFPSLIIVPGNHDFDKQMEELSYNPMRSLERLPNVTVYDKHRDSLISDKTGIPGKMGRIQIDFWGGGEFRSLDRMVNFLSQPVLEDAILRVAVLHASVAYRKKFKFEVIPFGKVAKFADVFLLGHLHDYQTVHPHGPIVAPGALSRGVLDRQEDLYRKVGYAVVELGLEAATVDATFIPLDVKSPDDVFKMDAKAQEVKEIAIVQSFVEYIQDLKIPEALTREQLIAHVKKLDISKEVKEKSIKVLEEL